MRVDPVMDLLASGRLATVERSGRHVEQLTDEQLLQDPARRLVVANVARADAFVAARFGRPAWDGQLLLELHRTPGQAAAGAGELALSTTVREGEAIARGHDYGVVVHEVGHLRPVADQVERSWNADGLSELSSDVLAWQATGDTATGRQLTGGAPVRDLASPRYRRVDELPAPFGHASRLGPGPRYVDPHLEGGPAGLALVRAAQETGVDDVGDLWFHALDRSLPLRTGTVPDPYGATTRAAQLESGLRYLQHRGRDLGGVLAASTVDAGRELGWSGADLRALQRAWRSVGVEAG